MNNRLSIHFSSQEKKETVHSFLKLESAKQRIPISDILYKMALIYQDKLNQNLVVGNSENNEEINNHSVQDIPDVVVTHKEATDLRELDENEFNEEDF